MATDLFETPELVPSAVWQLFEEWNNAASERAAYAACRKLLAQIEPMGYTFDFGLDGEPYNLKECERTVDC